MPPLLFSARALMVLMMLMPPFDSMVLAKIKVACVGDSITDQTCCGLVESQLYPTKLQEELGTEHYVVMEFADWGTTMLVNGDRPYCCFDEGQLYNSALNWNPDVVIIMFGANDSKSGNWGSHGGEFVQDAVAMYNSFFNLPSPPAVVFAAYPTKVHPTEACCSIQDSVISGEIIPGIDEAASQTGALVIDTYGYTQDKLDVTPPWYTDGVHLTPYGAQSIAKFFATYVEDLSLSPTPAPTGGSVIMQKSFDDDMDGFIYQDDTFGTSAPSYASGQHLSSGGFNDSGCLKVTLGGLNDADIFGISGGWEGGFTLSMEGNVTISFHYKLTQASDYESDEVSKVLVRVDQSDDVLVDEITGDGNGGGEQTTDWQFFSLDVAGTLSADTHSVTIGGYNNKKTWNNEVTEVWFDDVTVTSTPSSGPTTANPTSSPTSSPTQTPTASPQTGNYMETLVADVTAQWTLVSLRETYTSPVCVCSVRYVDDNEDPMVVRMQNVATTSFEIRLQNPSDEALASHSVHCIVVEEGSWVMPDGRGIEAWSYMSTVTDRKGSWVGEQQDYSNTYAQPVVLGQIMSFNDSKWSVFWSRGSSSKTPPSSTSFFSGKHVGEDTDITRTSETVGFIVIEAGHNKISGIEYEAALGADIVRGYDNSPLYSYTYDQAFIATPKVTVATQAAMDGGDGSCAVTSGTQSANTLQLVVDEDQITNSERRHTTEQVAYFVLSAEGSLELTRS